MKLIRIFLLVLMGVYFVNCSETQTAKSSVQTSIEVNGVNLYCNITGIGDTLIVLHGGPGLSHQYLLPQLDSLLSNDFTLVFYDQRGSGWSEGETDTSALKMDTFVEDLEALRIHLGLSKVNLLGHSFGGLLAMYYAVKYPEFTSSLVLVDTDAASYELRTPYQIKMINSRISEVQEAFLDSLSTTRKFEKFDPEVYTAYYKTFLTSYFADPKDTSHLFLGFDTTNVPKIGVTSRYVRRDLGKYDIHEKLSRITCPTLILQGDKSVFSMEGAEAIHSRIVNASLVVFEDCGHFEYIEAPDKFKSSILNFFSAQ